MPISESLWQGRVAGIYLTPERGLSLHSVSEVQAVAGRGLEGDRYFYHRGSFSRWPGRHRQLSLISTEALHIVRDRLGLDLDPSLTRRNLLVEDVPLNDLIGVRFKVGIVEVRGLRFCKPCRYLEQKAEIPNLFETLRGYGGLRAEILTDGPIRVRDHVTLSPSRSNQLELQG